MTTPTPESTHLRDARLHKALEHAPDAQAAAPAAMREAILRQARHAAAPPPASPAAAAPSPWWKRMLGSVFGAGRPWNTAFASVLLAGVVVGLWWDRDVPGPRPEAGTRDLPAAMPPPVAEAPDPPRSPAQRPSQPTASAPPPAPDRTEARDAPRPPPRPPTPAPLRREESKVAAPNAMPPPAAMQERSREKQSAAEAQDSRATDDTSAPPSTAAAQRRANDSRQASEVRSSRMAPVPAAPGALPAVAAASSLGTNALASRRSATQATVQEPAATPQAAGWTALQVLSSPARVRTRSALPADVAQAIALMLDTGPTGVPADDPVLLQIQLLHGSGQALGRLDLGSHSLRWTPAGAGTPRAFAARVEPALSLRVREELLRN